MAKAGAPGRRLRRGGGQGAARGDGQSGGGAVRSGGVGGAVAGRGGGGGAAGAAGGGALADPRGAWDDLIQSVIPDLIRDPPLSVLRWPRNPVRLRSKTKATRTSCPSCRYWNCARNN